MRKHATYRSAIEEIVLLTATERIKSIDPSDPRGIRIEHGSIFQDNDTDYPRFKDEIEKYAEGIVFRIAFEGQGVQHNPAATLGVLKEYFLNERPDLIPQVTRWLFERVPGSL